MTTPPKLTRPATPVASRATTVSDMPAVHDLAFDEDEVTIAQSVRSERVVDPPRRGAITVLRGPEPGRMFLLHPKTVLGRDRSCDVCIDDRGLSRLHARITHAAGVYVIEDLSSRNGTHVDGKRATRAELHDGARVVLSANVVLRFNLVDDVEERMTKQLFEASTRDALTGLYNRRYLEDRLAAEVSFAHRHREQLGFVMFDVDLFKQVNDTHGHPAGDAVLEGLGALLPKLVRTEDVMARYGGEEVALLVRGISKEGLGILADRIRRAVAEMRVRVTGVRGGDDVVRITISAGVASLAECDPNATGDLLVALADERLYVAKSGGRNQVCIG